MNIKNRAFLKLFQGLKRVNTAFFVLLTLLFCPENKPMTAAQRAWARTAPSVNRWINRSAISSGQIAPSVDSTQIPSRAFEPVETVTVEAPEKIRSGQIVTSCVQQPAPAQPLFKSPTKPRTASEAYANSLSRWFVTRSLPASTRGRGFSSARGFSSHAESSNANAVLLVEAMQSGSKEKLNELIKKGIVNINARYANNDTILHIAAKREVSPDIIELLVDAGAEVDAKNDYYKTPLHSAVEFDNVQAVKALVAKGANPNVLNKPDTMLKRFLSFSFLDQGKSPLYLAQENGWPRKDTFAIIKFLEPLTDASLWFVVTPEIRLRRAIRNENLPLLKNLLAQQSFSQETLNKSLFDIYYPNQATADILTLLLDAGADINTQMALLKDAALHQAARYGNLAAVQLLLKRNANPNAIDHKGRTALDLAREDVSSSESKLELIKILDAVTQQEKTHSSNAGDKQQVGKKLVGNQQELLNAAREISSRKSVDEILRSIVGVDTKASENDMHRAWLQWVKLHHPDRYQDEQLNQKATVVMQYLNEYLKNTR